MATTRVRNISGVDRDVPTPHGRVVQVKKNHQAEFDTDFARSLLAQSDNWEKVPEPRKAADKDGD
jgi:hypothetical protein